MNPVIRVQQVADGGIVVQRINNISNIFAHVTADIPFFFKQIRTPVNQVCRKDSRDKPLLVCLVKTLKAACEKTKGRGGKDAPCFSFLQVCGNFKHALARGNHVIDDNDILPLDTASKEFMCHNRVAPVHNFCIVTPFVEHTHVKPHDVCRVDCAAHAAFVRADNHHMVRIDGQIRHIAQ